MKIIEQLQGFSIRSLIGLAILAIFVLGGGPKVLHLVSDGCLLLAGALGGK